MNTRLLTLLGGLRPALDLNFITQAAPDGLQISSALDVVTLTGGDFTRWYNPEQGTFICEITTLGTGTSQRFFGVNDGSDNESIRGFIRASAAVGWTVNDGGVAQTDLSFGGPVAANVPFKFAGAYGKNDMAACYNGGPVSVDTTGTLPSPTQLQIGDGASAGAFMLNGYVRRIRYYKRRLPDSTLQRLTA